MITLQAEPLTAAVFTPYGEVIEAAGDFTLINNATTRQYADLANVDVTGGDGKPRVSVYRAAPYELPLRIGMLERHPLSSQLFMPLDGHPFLVVVAAAGDTVSPADIRAFVSNGRQGVNYRAGTWHHPVIAVGGETEFLVLDRSGPGRNCDEVFFDAEIEVRHAV